MKEIALTIGKIAGGVFLGILALTLYHKISKFLFSLISSPANAEGLAMVAVFTMVIFVFIWIVSGCYNDDLF